jgi:hypothetical protein
MRLEHEGVIENGSLENGEYIDHSSDIFDIIVLTTGIDAHTCYELESNSDAINIEVNISVLNRALRSAWGATHAQLRLTKKEKTPLLALTVLASEWTEGNIQAERRARFRTLILTSMLIASELDSSS